MNFQERTPTSISAPPPAVSPEQRRRVMRLTAIGVVAVLALLIAFNLVREHFKAAALAAFKLPPIPVLTEVIAPSSLPQYLTATGSITAVHQVTITPEVEGRVTQIAFEAGSTVKRGDVLIQLNDAPEQADLAAMRAQQKLAQLALDRQRRLLQSGFVAQAQLDQAQTQYDAATANIAKVSAVIAQKRIRAPFDGVLGMRWVEVGQYLAAGASITTLTQLSPLYINFTMPEQALPSLAVGQTVSITVDAFPGRTFPGRVVVIDPQIMTDTRTVRVQAEADNAEHLLASGMFAKVSVDLPAKPGVLTVPETAVDYSLYGSSVYVIREDKDKPGRPLSAARVPIEIGERANNRVAVLNGLKAGDRVVTTGQIRLFEGAAVTLSDHLPPPAQDLTAQ
jgi:multidrug efflux system membrane fusion protein